jgi:hypothetical protein
VWWLFDILPYAVAEAKSTANMHHRSRGFQKSRFSDMVARFLAFDRCNNVFAKLGIARSAPQPSIKIVLDLAEKAGPDLAI